MKYSRMMAYLQFVSAIALVFITTSCSARKDRIDLAGYSLISVGMTYDEVERALSSKPVEIWKGGSQIVYTENSPEYASLDGVNDYAHINACLQFLELVKADTLSWLIPSIQNTGQLIYTVWVMPDAPRKSDTVRVAIPLFRADTVYKSSMSYYISYDGGIGWLQETQSEYLAHRARKEAGEFSENVKLKAVKNERIVHNKFAELKVGYAQYVIDSQYCIIFDSSSGRVVQHTYLPLLVRLLSQ
jgi:hypothetical protein